MMDDDNEHHHTQHNKSRSFSLSNVWHNLKERSSGSKRQNNNSSSVSSPMTPPSSSSSSSSSHSTSTSKSSFYKSLKSRLKRRHGKQSENVVDANLSPKPHRPPPPTSPPPQPVPDNILDRVGSGLSFLDATEVDDADMDDSMNSRQLLREHYGLSDDDSMIRVDSSLESVDQLAVRLDDIVSDSEQFSKFLKWSDPRTQQELLFVLQVDQLISNEHSLSAESKIQEMERIFRIFLSADASSPAINEVISDDTMSGIRSCLSVGVFQRDAFVAARHEIERHITNHKLQRYLDFQNGVYNALSPSFANVSVDESGALVGVGNATSGKAAFFSYDSLASFEYEFVDVKTEPGVYQEFLLFLMKDRRHRMLLLWRVLEDLCLPDLEEEKLHELDVLELAGIARILDDTYRRYVGFGSNLAYPHSYRYVVTTSDERSPCCVEGSVNDDGSVCSVKQLSKDDVLLAVVNMLNVVRPVHAKTAKLLRLQCWPQFCKSEEYEHLLLRRMESSEQFRQMFPSPPVDDSTVTPPVSESSESSVQPQSSQGEAESASATKLLPPPRSMFAQNDRSKHSFSAYLRRHSGTCNGLIIASNSKSGVEVNEKGDVLLEVPSLCVYSKVVKNGKSQSKSVPVLLEEQCVGAPSPRHICEFCFPERSHDYNNELSPRLFSFVLTSTKHDRQYCVCLELRRQENDDDGNECVRAYAVCLVSSCITVLGKLRSALLVLLDAHKDVDTVDALWSTTAFQQCCGLVDVGVLNGGDEDDHESSGDCDGEELLVSKDDANSEQEPKPQYKTTTFRPAVDLIPSAPKGDMFNSFMMALHPARIVRVMEALALERKIILVSSHISLLTAAAECLRALLYPFEWHYPFIPFLPKHMYRYLQLPTPFVMGLYSSEHAYQVIDALQGDDIVVLDLDTDSVNSRTPYPAIFGGAKRQRLVASMSLLFRPQQVTNDYPRCNGVEVVNSTPPHARLRAIWMNVFAEVLHGYRYFCVHMKPGESANTQHGVMFFDSESFLAARTSESREFITMFLGTQSFAEFLAERFNHSGLRPIVLSRADGDELHDIVDVDEVTDDRKDAWRCAFDVYQVCADIGFANVRSVGSWFVTTTNNNNTQ